MEALSLIVRNLSGQYHKVRSDVEFAAKRKLPGNSYFLDDSAILSIPRDDGDCRYPYGNDGLNFWVYASGYMHGNEGLFSTFLRSSEGQEPKIAFFIGFPDNDGGFDVAPLLSVPVMGGESRGDCIDERYTVFARNCVYFITEIRDMIFAVRVFTDTEKRLFFTVSAENLSDENRQFFISAYMNPFFSNSLYESSESRWFKEVRYYRANADGIDLGHFSIKVNEDQSRTVSVSNIGVLHRNIRMAGNSRLIRHEETTSRYQFVGGRRSSLHSPVALKKGTFGEERHVCTFTDIGIAGDIVSLETGSAGNIRYDLVLGYMTNCKEESEAERLFKEKFSPEEIDAKLSSLEDQEKKLNESIGCKVIKSNSLPIEDNIFNSFFVHLKKQVEFCSLIKGYVNLWTGSLIGIRDIFQALEGLLFWEPEAARKKMLEAFDYVFINGRCPRQYSLPVREGLPPVMDIRAFIDQGCWVISTVCTYLKFTGDTAFLDEICGYYEIVDEKKGQVRKSDRRESVLRHLVKIMDYLLSSRDFESTGCIRALYGDWNDALDGLGVSCDPGSEFGSGVSVMATLQVYQNLMEMIELLIRVDEEKYVDIIDQYRSVRRELEESLEKFAVICDEKGEKRILHGWGDKRSYLVGSFDDPDHHSRHGLTSNAFWVLSGMYDNDKEMESTILNALEKLDSQYGFKTFEPYFPVNTPGVGRIPKLPAGTAENGAVYIHASAFAVMALFRMGRPENAWKQLFKLLPFTHERISCSPYVMPNSYGFNEEKLIDGESMNDWQTGSSNVIFKTFVRYVIGFEPEYDGIWIQPAYYLPFTGFDFNIEVRSCRIRIVYENSGTGHRKFKVNGMEREGIFDGTMGIERLWISKSELDCPNIFIEIKNNPFIYRPFPGAVSIH